MQVQQQVVPEMEQVLALVVPLDMVMVLVTAMEMP